MSQCMQRTEDRHGWDIGKEFKWVRLKDRKTGNSFRAMYNIQVLDLILKYKSHQKNLTLR